VVMSLRACTEPTVVAARLVVPVELETDIRIALCVRSEVTFTCLLSGYRRHASPRFELRSPPHRTPVRKPGPGCPGNSTATDIDGVIDYPGEKKPRWSVVKGGPPKGTQKRPSHTKNQKHPPPPPPAPPPPPTHNIPETHKTPHSPPPPPTPPHHPPTHSHCSPHQSPYFRANSALSCVWYRLIAIYEQFYRLYLCPNLSRALVRGGRDPAIAIVADEVVSPTVTHTPPNRDPSRLCSGRRSSCPCIPLMLLPATKMPAATIAVLCLRSDFAQLG